MRDWERAHLYLLESEIRRWKQRCGKEGVQSEPPTTTSTTITTRAQFDITFLFLCFCQSAVSLHSLFSAADDRRLQTRDTSRPDGRGTDGMKISRSRLGPRIRLTNGWTISPCVFFAIAVLLIPTCMVFLISGDQLLTPLLQQQQSSQSKGKYTFEKSVCR